MESTVYIGDFIVPCPRVDFAGDVHALTSARSLRVEISKIFHKCTLFATSTRGNLQSPCVDINFHQGLAFLNQELKAVSSNASPGLTVLFWDDDLGFLNEQVKTSYQMAPRSPLNLPTYFLCLHVYIVYGCTGSNSYSVPSPTSNQLVEHDLHGAVIFSCLIARGLCRTFS